ncbi:MAG TPA: biopolymer transporter ExbD [Methylophaga sp.]|nr:biopolymer transporter ExbD [Methylophaga sp.]
MLLEIAPRKRRNLISLTPLIDVVFILLLFFMLSSSFIRWHQINLQSASESQSQTPDLRILKIESNEGQLSFNGTRLFMNDDAGIQKFVAENKQATFVITVIEGIKIQVMVDLLDQLKQAGATKVSLAGLAE